MKVAILGKLDHELDIERKELGDDVTVEVIEDPEKEIDRLADYDGFLSWHFVPFTKEMIEKATKCKAICRIATGYDNIDLEEAGKRDIPVTNVPDYGTEEVADSAMGNLLNLLRKNAQIAKDQAGENPKQIVPTDLIKTYSMHRVSSKELGIIGLGSIGTALAMRAKAFNMKVSYFDPAVPPATNKSLGIHCYDTVEELLKNADVISLHCPLNDKTKNLLNKDSLKTCKKGVYVINVARGELIDEDALSEALKSGHVAGAALDTVCKEPYDGYLSKVPNLIITPHSAFCSFESMDEMRMKSAQELRRIFDGKDAKNLVNQKFLKSEKEKQDKDN